MDTFINAALAMLMIPVVFAIGILMLLFNRARGRTKEIPEESVIVVKHVRVIDGSSGMDLSHEESYNSALLQDIMHNISHDSYEDFISSYNLSENAHHPESKSGRFANIWWSSISRDPVLKSIVLTIYVIPGHGITYSAQWLRGDDDVTITQTVALYGVLAMVYENMLRRKLERALIQCSNAIADRLGGIHR